jgi:hypothetical protein
VERQVRVAEDDVQVGLSQHLAEDLHRIAGHADGADLARLLEPSQGGDRLLDDDLRVDELDVVADHDVEVVDAKSGQARVDALLDARGRVVEARDAEAADLRADPVAVARDTPECETQEDLGPPPSVVGSSVEEVDAGVQRMGDRTERGAEVDLPVFLAERRGPESEAGDFEAGVAESALLHRLRV